jgi:hypothetical protein
MMCLADLSEIRAGSLDRAGLGDPPEVRSETKEPGAPLWFGLGGSLDGPTLVVGSESQARPKSQARQNPLMHGSRRQDLRR